MSESTTLLQKANMLADLLDSQAVAATRYDKYWAESVDGRFIQSAAATIKDLTAALSASSASSGVGGEAGLLSKLSKCFEAVEKHIANIGFYYETEQYAGIADVLDGGEGFEAINILQSRVWGAIAELRSALAAASGGGGAERKTIAAADVVTALTSCIADPEQYPKRSDRDIAFYNNGTLLAIAIALGLEDEYTDACSTPSSAPLQRVEDSQADEKGGVKGE